MKTLTQERWQYWLSLKTWSAHEAVAVLLGIEPEGCDPQAVQAAFESDEMGRLERHFVRDGLMEFSEVKGDDGKLRSSNERHSPADWLDSFQRFGELSFPLMAGAAGDEAELNPKSRNVMLKIIGGMAMAGWGLDIHAPRMNEGFKELLADLERLGCGVSERALRGYLKEAAELIKKQPKS